MSLYAWFKAGCTPHQEVGGAMVKGETASYPVGWVGMRFADSVITQP